MNALTFGNWTGRLNMGLAERELQCVLAIASGSTSKEIARELGISPATVDKRVLAASTKLGVVRRGALVAEAFRRGLIAPVAVGMIALVCAHAVFGDDPGMRNRRMGERRIELRQGGRRAEDIQFAA